MINANVQKLVTMIMALTFSIAMCTAPAFADEAQCRDVLKKCDTALQATEADSALQRQIIADQTSLINDQQKQIKSESIWKPIAEGSLAFAVLTTLVLVLKK